MIRRLNMSSRLARLPNSGNSGSWEVSRSALEGASEKRLILWCGFFLVSKSVSSIAEPFLLLLLYQYHAIA